LVQRFRRVPGTRSQPDRGARGYCENKRSV